MAEKLTVINRIAVEQHRAAAPLPIEVEKNESEEPIVLPTNRVVVMPGDYYNSELGLALSAFDIGETGAWEEVK